MRERIDLFIGHRPALDVSNIRLASRVIVPLLACVFMIIGTELVLRVVRQPDLLLDATIGAVHGQASQFELDDEMGYQPILGEGLSYSKEGILGARPPAKTEKKTRVLFIGDSVTARGRIIRALASEYQDGTLETLNSGVEGFNVIQEVAFYRRYNWRVSPDIVVLTLHNNDLDFYPMVYKARDGLIFWYLYGQPRVLIDPNLMQWSRLYQEYTAFRGARLVQNARKTDALFRETRSSLQRLNDDLMKSGAKLKVLVLPILAPLNQWEPSQVESRRQALRILNEIGIEHDDLLEPLESGLRNKVQIAETFGDTWHPSDAISEYFARYLKARHFLN
jgi:hypothetical protein